MTKNLFSQNGGKHNVPVNRIRKKPLRIFFASENGPTALASLCQNLEMFCPAGTKLWLKMQKY